MTTRRAKPLSFTRDEAEEAPTIRIAPLVDIVLLLICFYLVVNRSIQTHDDPLVQLPFMHEQRTAPPQPAELVINLREDGTLFVNARLVELDGLPGLLVHERGRAEARGQSLDVVVRADNRQRYARLDAVLEACRAAGLDRVVLRSTEEPPP